MIRSSARTWFAAAAAALLLASGAMAQTVGGTVYGRVSDESGSPLSGVAVVAKNLGTGQTRSVTTDAAGLFRMVELSVGNYEVTVAASGFATEVRAGIRLQIGQQADLTFQLKVAKVAETVTVQAATPIIETSKSAIGANITTRQIDELPLLGAQLPEPHLPDARDHDQRPRGRDDHLGRGKQRGQQHVPDRRHEQRSGHPRRNTRRLLARRDRRVRGPLEPVRCPVRSGLGGDHQRAHALGNQRPPRATLRLLPSQCPGGERCLCSDESRYPREGADDLQPVDRQRLPGRADREGQALLLRLLRADLARRDRGRGGEPGHPRGARPAGRDGRPAGSA